MRTTTFLLASAAVFTICAFGTPQVANCTTVGDKYQETTIVPQTDPLIVELDSFGGRQFTGERSYIGIFNNQVTAVIPTVAGMARTGVVTSTRALTFDKAPAEISKARIGKKGNSYSFSVDTRDGTFFNRDINGTWRINMTVRNDGFVDVSIESESIATVYQSRVWYFVGHVNKDRTEAAKMVKDSMPEL